MLLNPYRNWKERSTDISCEKHKIIFLMTPYSLKFTETAIEKRALRILNSKHVVDLLKRFSNNC